MKSTKTRKTVKKGAQSNPSFAYHRRERGGNSMSQVTNLAFFRARRGQSEALGAALAALVEPTRLEAGCLNYDLHRSVDDADVWFDYENWRSPEGFDAHMLSEHLKATPDLVAGNAPHLNATSISKSNRNTPMLFSGKNIIVTGATGDLGVA